MHLYPPNPALDNGWDSGVWVTGFGGSTPPFVSMELEEAKKRLAELRKEWPKAEFPRQLEIEKEASDIKSDFSFCRQCGELTPPGEWWCSKECQDAYYGPIEEKRSTPVKAAQLKCLEYAAELREKKDKPATFKDAERIFSS